MTSFNTSQINEIIWADIKRWLENIAISVAYVLIAYFTAITSGVKHEEAVYVTIPTVLWVLTDAVRKYKDFRMYER